MAKTQAIDYESPFPECRALATADPHALVRFDMNRDQAALFAKQCRHAIDRHDGDGLVTLGLTMQEDTFRVFATQIENLVDISADAGGEVISAQVVIDRELEVEDSDGISVSVLLNESQLHGVYENAQDSLAQSDGDVHRWEFSVSQSGAELLVQQIIAAVKGADEPLDHVDADSVEVDDA